MTDSGDLVKVHIDLAGHPETGGESMWAKPLGGDLYELRNVPFFAYHLNWLDVVRAVEPDPDSKPEIEEVVRRSGHRTIWVTFSDALPPVECSTLLKQLNQWEASFEGATPTYFAVDVEPHGDWDQVVSQLGAWAAEGILAYRLADPGALRWQDA
jgi:hypothetical protein